MVWRTSVFGFSFSELHLELKVVLVVQCYLQRRYELLQLQPLRPDLEEFIVEHALQPVSLQIAYLHPDDVSHTIIPRGDVAVAFL